MRNRGYLVLAVIVLVSLLNPVQAATPKAGAKCTKVGATSTFAGKKFTCIKSGQRLQWNKGVAIKAAPKPSLNPVLKPVEPTPTPTPTPIATPTPTPTPTPLTRRQKAFAEIQRVYQSNTNYEIPVKYIFSSDAPPNFGEMLKLVVPISAKFWSDIFRPSGDFPVILGTPQSIEWVNDQMKLYGHEIQIWTRNKVAEQGEKASRGDVVNNSRGSITYYVIGKEADRSVYGGNELMMRGFVAHEYVHSVAVSILGDRQEGIPGWSVEGSANYYGHAIAAAMSQSPDTSISKVVKTNLRRAYTENGALIPHSINKDELFKAIVTSEKGGGGDGTTCAEPKILCYTAGELMTEVLLADHGHDKFVSWWRLSKKKNWEVAFEETYGLQIDKWYEEIAVPYIIEESKAAIPEVTAPASSTTFTQHPARLPRPFVDPGSKNSKG